MTEILSYDAYNLICLTTTEVLMATTENQVKVILIFYTKIHL